MADSKQTVPTDPKAAEAFWLRLLLRELQEMIDRASS